MSTYKVPDLDRKVAFVAGNCEFIRIRQILIQKYIKEPPLKRILDSTKQTAIAEQLCVSASQWSRMKKGTETISDIHLARLSEYFDVDRSCDFLVWIKPYDVFINTLTSLGYGRLRYRGKGPTLLDVLNNYSGHEDRINLRILTVSSPSASVRGIGATAHSPLSTPELYLGDQVQVLVSHDNHRGLHLMVLSYDPNNSFTVLAPVNSGSPLQTVGPDTVLPSSDTAYPVGRPVGPHILYAVLTKETLGLETSMNLNAPFPTLSDTEADTLRDEIAGRNDETVFVQSLSYEVIR